MKRYVKSTSFAPTEYEDFDYRMFGEYKCSCGCGKLLGRPTNGTDGYPIDLSHVVSEKDDDEGYEWRSFTRNCWARVSSEYNNDLGAIYNAFGPAEYVD